MLYNLPPKGVILAIDLGQKVCGLAVTDPSQSLAFPLNEIEYQSEDHFISQIHTLVDLKKVQGFLLGLPYTLGDQKKFIHEWIEKQELLLKENFDLPLAFMDESLTSVEAKLKSSKKHERIDSEAALLFLQKYLESRHGFSFHEL